ncbi:hypothetical protein [Parafilimonas sp.]|uniref:hypothetical protein n=1 Tax=Parafilimonas sp. TaxID=1969739 RepID=UPI003F7CE436
MKFIFGQSEKKLDDTIKVSDLITSRTNNLITIISAIIIALSAYIIQQWQTGDINNKIWSAIAGFVYLISLIVYIIRNILPNNYYVPGLYPKDVVIDKYYKTKFPKDVSLIFVIMNEIENYEFRISSNEKLNDDRWAKYICSVIALLLMPLTVGILFCVLQITHH